MNIAIDIERNDPVNTENQAPLNDRDFDFVSDSLVDPEVPPSPDEFEGADFISSPQYNMMALCISLSKIVTSITFLLFMPTYCPGSKLNWCLMILGLDVCNSIVLIFRLQLQKNQNRRVSTTEVDQLSPLVDNEERTTEIQRKLERKKEIVSAFQILLNIVFLGAFIYGQVLYFLVDANDCEEELLNLLVIIYLIMGYLWLLLPFVAVMSLTFLGCICFPVLFCLYMAANRTQVPANNAAIRKLKVESYTTEIEGPPECAICMVEYNENDKIIKLGCSKMHLFHEDCIKKWLKINGQCPTCRMRLEEMGRDGNDE